MKREWLAAKFECPELLKSALCRSTLSVPWRPMGYKMETGW